MNDTPTPSALIEQAAALLETIEHFGVLLVETTDMEAAHKASAVKHLAAEALGLLNKALECDRDSAKAETKQGAPDASGAAAAIDQGLGLLASLATILNKATADDMAAACALCQKAGAFLERGTRAALGITGAGVVGDPSDWLGLGDVHSA